MEPISITVDASDCLAFQVEIVDITSNEPVTGGSDTTTPDWEITGPLTASLRAERSNDGLGRLYTITVRATDSVGNVSHRTTSVLVPKNQKRKSRAEL